MNSRVVIDPGVFVSASLVPHGPPAQIVDAWSDGRFDLIVCPLLLDELGEVLARDKFAGMISPADRERLLRLLAVEATTVADPEVVEGATGDPKDDYLAALAVDIRATHLVTGDRVLRDWEHEGVVVVTPRAFLDLLESEGSAT